MRLLIAMAVLLAVPSTAMAQRWGRERFPASGACFFENSDYRGDYFCVAAGDTVRAVPDDLNDRISSVRIFGNADVTVFRDERFNGRSSRFQSSVRDLKDEGWNNRISSLRVERESRFGRQSDDRRDRDRDRRREDPDRIIQRAYQDLLGRDPDTDGLRHYRRLMVDDDWSEEKVRDSLKSSAEYRERNTMTRPKADEIVRRAYLNVLRREPDPAGSQGYVNNVLRDKWSQQDVERELRKSAEFRDRK